MAMKKCLYRIFKMKNYLLFLCCLFFLTPCLAAPITPEVTACTNECVKELENACKIQCGTYQPVKCLNQLKYSEEATHERECKYKCNEESEARCSNKGLKVNCEGYTITSDLMVCQQQCSEICYQEEVVRKKDNCIVNTCSSQKNRYYSYACHSFCMYSPFSNVSTSLEKKNKE